MLQHAQQKITAPLPGARIKDAPAVLPHVLLHGGLLQLSRHPAVWLLVAAWTLALLLLWPLPLQFATLTLDTGDALHEAWIIHYFQQWLSNPAAAPFAAPANYPYATPLLLNPPLYTSAVIGMPFFWLGWGPVAVYNLLTLLSFVLACWAMALLGRELTGNSFAGLVAGGIYAFAHVRLAHLVHLNLLSSGWTVLLLWLLVRSWRRPPVTRRGLAGLALAAGLLCAAQALADVYNAVFLVCAVSLFAVYQLLTRRWGLPLRPTLALAAGAILAALVCLPVVLPTLQAWQDLGVARQWDDHIAWRATPVHYLTPHHQALLPYDLAELRDPAAPTGGPEWTLWPGLPALLLAGAGLVVARCEWRRLQIFFLLLALVTFGLSFGPLLPTDEPVPNPLYRWLYDHVPLFAAVRVASRWALLLQLALAVLAAYGVAGLLWAAGRRRAMRLLFGLALGGLVLAEYWPQQLLARAVTLENPPAVYAQLRDLPPGALLEWPLENSSATLKHRQQYATIYHNRPLVNSAASAVPARYDELHAALRDFPSVAATTLLRDLGVGYVVVDHYAIGDWNITGPPIMAAPGLELVYTDERHQLYAVRDEQPALPAPLASSGELPGGPRIVLQVAAPLWLNDAAQYYTAAAPVELTLHLTDGTRMPFEAVLPPALLPGTHLLPAPRALDTVVAVEIAGQVIPLYGAPEAVAAVDGLQLVAGELPQVIAPGAVLPCPLYGRGVAERSGLVLSLNLVDGGWQFLAKQDHFFDAGLPAPDAWQPSIFMPVGCTLSIPANLPPGEYFLAIGLYDPAQQSFVTFAGPDGAPIDGLWRLHEPLHVNTAVAAVR